MKAELVARTFVCPRADNDDGEGDFGAALQREGIEANDVQDITLSIDNCYYVTIYCDDKVRGEERDRVAVERAVVSLGNKS